jgi:predicted dehydrogenase
MHSTKVGVIGTGFIGPAHVEALRRLPGIEVVALADKGEELANAKAGLLGIPAAYGDYRNLLARPEIEAVHICTPNTFHYTMAREALLAGKHVVCEKPLATTAAEAAELVQLADRLGLVNAVHFNVRYYPLMRQVKLMAAKGELGRIFSIHGSYLQDWLYYDTDYNWRLEPAFSGGSRAVADIGSHWMDLVEYVSGLRIAAVFADFAIFHESRKKPLKPIETYAGKLLAPEDYQAVPISTEDYASVLFRFEGGARGSLVVSQVSAGRKNRIYFEMDGSRESVEWNSERPNTVWIGRRDGNNQEMMKDPSLVYPESQQLIGFPGGHQEGFPDTSKQLFKEFYGYLAEHRDPQRVSRISGDPGKDVPSFPTFRAGLREIELCDGILESARKGAWIPVQPWTKGA